MTNIAQLKQCYLHASLPHPPASFEAERNAQYSRLLFLLTSTDRNRWMSTGFNIGSLIESYKQVYGLTIGEYEELLYILINIGVEEQAVSCEVRSMIFKIVNTMADYQIQVSPNFMISNTKLLHMLTGYKNEGVRGSLKTSDTFVGQLCKCIIFFSKFGQDISDQALQLAISTRQLKFVLLFIPSIKSTSSATKLIRQLFIDSSLWDRDVCWFYILSQLIKKFPKLDLSPYYKIILMQCIKIFMTLIDPPTNNDEIIKKIVNPDAFLNIRSSLKSTSLLLVSMILPSSSPLGQTIWAPINRLFSLITTSLDHINPPDVLTEYLIFMRAFVKSFVQRYRKERGMYLLINQDDIQDYHGKEEEIVLDQPNQTKFDTLWIEIIPKLLHFQDSQQYKPSKILADLCMYKPDLFIPITLEAITSILTRNDLTLISLHATKMALLFVQQFIIYYQPSHLPAYLTCMKLILAAAETLGITDNMDIIELVFRMFHYFSEEDLDRREVCDLFEDGLDIVLNNLDASSIGLEGSQSDDGELYLDFGNIYMPFFLRVPGEMFQKFKEKFIYKLSNSIPQHRVSYMYLTIIVSFRDPTFPMTMLPHLVKQLIGGSAKLSNGSSTGSSTNTNNIHTNTNNATTNTTMNEFLPKCERHLLSLNQNNIRWFAIILQCCFQYHPENIITAWDQIQCVIIALMTQNENSAFLQIALDILYNLMICLGHQHIGWQQFVKPANANYKTLKIQWQSPSNSSIALLLRIYKTYYTDLTQYLKNRYQSILLQSPSNPLSLSDYIPVEEYQRGNDTIRARKRNLKLIDAMLIAQIGKAEDLQERKTIYKIVSTQYTVMSALMIVAPYFPDFPLSSEYYPQFKDVRKTACQHLQWLLSLFQHYSLLSQPDYLKLFNYFWRQAHDQVYFSTQIDLTNQKLSPYYYPEIYRKKQLMRSPFLLVNELYLLHMCRLELFLQISPTAYLNNPAYYQSNFILGVSNNFQAVLHSYIPSNVDVHQYHREVLSICRCRLDPKRQDSYTAKYLSSAKNSPEGEKYLNAIKTLLMSIKKVQNVYSYDCCLKDQFVASSILEMTFLFKILHGKAQKIMIVELFFVLLMFGFEGSLLKDKPMIDWGQIMRKHTYARQQQQNMEQAQLCVGLKKHVDYYQVLKLFDEEDELQTRIHQVMVMKLTRSCSNYDKSTNYEMHLQIQRFLTLLLPKLSIPVTSLDKDAIIHTLMMIIYSNLLPLSHHLLGDVIRILFSLCRSEIVEVFDVSKTGLFHIINRFNLSKRRAVVYKNTVIPREWDQFLTMRMIGGDKVNYRQLKIDKNDFFYYHQPELVQYSYSQLCSDKSSLSYTNQQILLNHLKSQSMKLFFQNCLKDPQLKEVDQTNQSVNLQDDSGKGMSSTGHRLLHFIWDYNPKKVDIFSAFIDNFTVYHLNFYCRLIRKIIRIGTNEVRQNLKGIALKLQQSSNTTQSQPLKLSLHISFQLIAYNINDPFTEKFIMFMAESTKEVFDYSLVCFYNTFCINFQIAKDVFRQFILRFINLKNAARLRHLQILNTYMIAQGRFSRKAAQQAISSLLEGINEGADQVSQTLVTMISQCFVIAINLKDAGCWVKDDLQNLTREGKLYQLDSDVGYAIDQSLTKIMGVIIQMTKKQEISDRSNNLKIYSQIARKVLASLTIYRFNDSFYNLLKDLIQYVIVKPSDDSGSDQTVIAQLRDSYYPKHIYQNLIALMIDTSNDALPIIRKKLRYTEGMVIIHSFCQNKVQIPQVMNGGKVILDSILAYSNMARIMTKEELDAAVQKEMGKQKKDLNKLMAYLLAAGVRSHQWKQAVLREILKHKKQKIVKEFVAEWWKGKTPQTQQDMRLQQLVKNVQNPFTYFA